MDDAKKPGGDADAAAVEQLRDLETVSEAALAHLRLDDLLDELLTRISGILGVDTAAVLLLDDESGEPVARAAKGLEEEKGPESQLGVPLLVAGERIGDLRVGSLTPREFGERDVTVLQLVADRIALAIDHARLFEAERKAREAAEAAADRIARLQSITDVALAHLAFDDELLNEMLVRVRENLSVDTAAILLLDDETHELVARAAKGLEEEVQQGVRIPVGGGFAGRIAATARPVVIESVDHGSVLNPILREKGVRSLLGVPLLVEGRVLGVLHVGTLSPRSFGEDSIAFLQFAADRIALAIDNARLFEREHLVAASLQRSFLPSHLPRVAGLELAARYRPGAGESQLGGDWYDAVVLPDGHIGIALGDVVSRGLRAASVTAQLRNALRAYVLDGHGPAVLLTRLSRLTRTLEGREMATLVYLSVDPESGKVTMASAGHPPPLVVEPGGGTRFLEGGLSVPLGALAHPVYEEVEFELPPGSLVMAYTDGLVERRDLWVDEGMEELRRAAPRIGGDVDAFCDGVLDEMLGHSPSSDDVALIALRFAPARENRISLEAPADAEELAGMRRAMRSWLAGVGAGEEESYEMIVATTEAAANAIEHAYALGEAFFRVQGALEGDEVRIEVSDSGRWRPPRGTNRGRGTLLMQELTDGFEVLTGEQGTVVHLRRRLRGNRSAA
jgi:GAF domain-containing protein/anti-sigma regulatory factor (Ser/Thr protein kinase)